MNRNLGNAQDEDIESQLTRLGNSLHCRLSLRTTVLKRMEASGLLTIIAENRQRRVRCRNLTMLQKLSIGGLAVTATLLVALVCPLNTANSYAHVIKNLKNATSYRAEVKFVNADQGIATKSIAQSWIWYWQASDWVRFETLSHGMNPELAEGPSQVEIASESQPGIRVDMIRNTYQILPARRLFGCWVSRLQDVNSFRSTSSKELGIKSIDGRDCFGFEIPGTNVDSLFTQNSRLTLWIDKKSQLPWHVTIQIGRTTIVMERFVWNAPLDPRLFDTSPPKGFFLDQEHELTLDELVTEMKAAFRLYAERNNGMYPQFRGIYHSIAFESLLELSGIDPRKPDWKSEKEHTVRTTERAWRKMEEILRKDETAKYNGLTVGPQDNDKVLFEWKLDDGSYQKIYGDLHTENAK